jgi:signal transduction histidine kinase
MSSTLVEILESVVVSRWDSTLLLMKREGFDYSITLTLEVRPQKDYSETEAQDINSIVTELMRNARKAIYHCEDPRRSPNTEELKMIKGQIDVKLDESEKNYLISVKDNGDGIPEDNRAKVWVTGFSTRHTNGLGLGVALEKTHNLGGDLYFESEVGQGTTFYLKLPKE